MLVLPDPVIPCSILVGEGFLLMVWSAVCWAELSGILGGVLEFVNEEGAGSLARRFLVMP